MAPLLTLLSHFKRLETSHHLDFLTQCFTLPVILCREIVETHRLRDRSTNRVPFQVLKCIIIYLFTII